MCRYKWQAGGASVRGAKHKRTNLPNQDAHFATPSTESSGNFLVAVADGHGSAPHFRSEIGSSFAVEAAIDALDWDLDSVGDGKDLIADVVNIWRQKVTTHLNDNPIESPGQNVFMPYGSTLVVVAANAQTMAALQIGDGDLVLGYPGGKLERPFDADEGLHGEQTYSLCLDEAEYFTKVWAISGQHDKWPDFALVATDGISKSFVDDETFLEVVSQYRSIVDSPEKMQATIDALPAWLEQVSAAGSGDDASLCFVSRRFEGS